MFYRSNTIWVQVQFLMFSLLPTMNRTSGDFDNFRDLVTIGLSYNFNICDRHYIHILMVANLLNDSDVNE